MTTLHFVPNAWAWWEIGGIALMLVGAALLGLVIVSIAIRK